jgi:endonuclease I
MNRPTIFTLLLFLTGSLTAQIPSGYYNSANGLAGTQLQLALHNIIDDHTVISYGDLWDYFEDTDKKSNGKVWDIYSDIPGGTPPYEFTFYTDQCGNYNEEGDCYNKEHSFPKSWFGGEVYPMYSDLFHVYPTDGWVNNKRGNYEYGEVNNASWTSMNGSKLGNCSYSGYNGTVFEPIDGYKGDLARTYFYMATRYYGEDGNWPGSEMTNGAQPLEWALNMLYDWHLQDPVSQKEISRNNAIYQIQDNRNPFIDHPEYAGVIWFNTTVENELMDVSDFRIYPNPVTDFLHLKISGSLEREELTLTITDQTGKKLIEKPTSGISKVSIDVSQLAGGFYLLHISSDKSHEEVCFKLVK